MKKALRIKAKNARLKFDVNKSSGKILEHIYGWDIFKNAKNVMIYCPIQNEIDLLGLLGCKDKSFYMPKIQDEEICIVKFTSTEDMCIGKYDIKEPDCCVYEKPDIVDMVFIPALMADEWGYRLGFGKGYYDRFLEKLPARTLKVIPMYRELFVEELPIEPHDQNADYVITEDGIVSTRIVLG